MYGYDDDEVPRSVTLADFAVVAASFVHNITSSFHSLADDLLQLAVYHSTRNNKVSQVWEEFAQDLEKMEDGNG